MHVSVQLARLQLVHSLKSYSFQVGELLVTGTFLAVLLFFVVIGIESKQ